MKSDCRQQGFTLIQISILLTVASLVMVNILPSLLGNRVQEFNSTGTYQMKFGSSGSGNGKFNGIDNIAIDAGGNLWITDSNNNRVQEINSSGTYLSQFGSSTLSSPIGIHIDSSGNIWVGDSGNNRVAEFNTSGTLLRQFGSYGTANGKFSPQYSSPFNLTMSR